MTTASTILENEAGHLIAALFVEKYGCYSGSKLIDVWDAERDAKNYDKDLPVVAHPPCQLWGNMAYVNYARWGGEHNKPGNDGGCFYSALSSVRRCGGVLEHPANTRAFDEYGIAKPTNNGWQKTIDDGWVCEVWQSVYGHKANKKTWLYYYGKNAPFQLNWEKPIGTHQIGGADQRGKAKNKPTIRGKQASATPIKFRNELIKLAIFSNHEF